MSERRSLKALDLHHAGADGKSGEGGADHSEAAPRPLAGWWVSFAELRCPTKNSQNHPARPRCSDLLLLPTLTQFPPPDNEVDLPIHRDSSPDISYLPPSKKSCRRQSLSCKSPAGGASSSHGAPPVRPANEYLSIQTLSSTQSPTLGYHRVIKLPALPRYFQPSCIQTPNVNVAPRTTGVRGPFSEHNPASPSKKLVAHNLLPIARNRDLFEMSPQHNKHASWARFSASPRRTRSSMTYKPSYTHNSQNSAVDVETNSDIEAQDGNTNDTKDAEDDRSDAASQPAVVAPSHGSKTHATRGATGRAEILVQSGVDHPQRTMHSSSVNHETGLNEVNSKSSLPNSKKRSLSKMQEKTTSTSGDEDEEDPAEDSENRGKRAVRKLSMAQSPRTPSKRGRPRGRPQRHDPSRSATISEDDDDEIYNDVDLISDSDEDEPNLEQVEEKLIIDSEEESDDLLDVQNTPLAPANDLCIDNVPFFDEQIGTLDPDRANDIAIFNAATAVEAESSQTSPSRKSGLRVRFDDEVIQSDSSSNDTSDEDLNVFPDLFLQQESLNADLRGLIENDREIDSWLPSSDGDSSYWDLRGSDDMDFTPYGAPEPSTSGESDGSSSGYETDEGETTDEDLPPPPTVTRTRSVLRRPSTSSLDGHGLNSITSFRDNIRRDHTHRRGPSMYSWVADPDKPFVVVDRTGKRMIFHPAPRQAAMSNNSSFANTSPHVLSSPFHDDSENDLNFYSNQSTPLFTSATNLIMGGLLQGTPGSEYLDRGQATGPPEAFYPFTSISRDGSVDDGGDESEDMWELKDLIDFGDGSSSDEAEPDKENSTPTSPTSPLLGCPTSSTEHSPARQRSISDGEEVAQRMLEHFDNRDITAFRNRKEYLKLAIPPSTPRRYPTISAASFSQNSIKGGRLAAANLPISPLRKHKFNRTPPTQPTRGTFTHTGTRVKSMNHYQRNRNMF